MVPELQNFGTRVPTVSTICEGTERRAPTGQTLGFAFLLVCVMGTRKSSWEVGWAASSTDKTSAWNFSCCRALRPGVCCFLFKCFPVSQILASILHSRHGEVEQVPQVQVAGSPWSAALTINRQ